MVNWLAIAIPLIYGMLFVAETVTYMHPLRKKLHGSVTAIDYNRQKEMVFGLRILQTALLPMVGLLIDLDASVDVVSGIVWVSFLSSFLFLLLISFLLGRSVGIGLMDFATRLDARWLALNTIYLAQFLGTPIALYFAALSEEYQTTILQMTAFVNFLSGYMQVKIIDRKVSALIDRDLDMDVYRKVFSNILLGRLVGKMCLVVLATLII